MGVVLGERDIRREIMKHRGRFVKKNCWQAPIAGEMCRSCRCTSDCGYFLPLLTSSCWKAHKWLLQNEGHNFSYFPFATAFIFWQENFSLTTLLCSKWRRSSFTKAEDYLFKNNKFQTKELNAGWWGRQPWILAAAWAGGTDLLVPSL